MQAVCRQCRGIEAVITGLTRNQFGRKPTWVRIPASAPKENHLLINFNLTVGGFFVLKTIGSQLYPVIKDGFKLFFLNIRRDKDETKLMFPEMANKKH